MRAFKPETFAQRRSKLLAAIGDDAIAIFVAPPGRTRSHDTEYPYRPSSDIVYLSGFEEPGTVLVLAPGSDNEFVMFVRERDPEKETWDGRRSGPEGAINTYGADAAFTLEELDEELPKILEGRDALFYTLGDNAEFDQKVVGWVHARHRRSKPPGAPRVIVDARDILHEMRVHKTDEEIAIMQQACDITAEAHTLAMRHCHVGMREFEIQAIIENHFRANGSDFPAYTSIVGAGDNATILHYIENRDEMIDGDVLLIDAGCEFGFYAADITRSFPVSGTFNAAQKDVYQAVLEVQIKACNDAVVGKKYDELAEDATRGLCDALSQLGVFDQSGDAVFEEELYKRYYPHKLGHFLGMDVHDVGTYYDSNGEWRLLEEGMVITIEPGLYFPAHDERVPEAFRGLGIRIEDDVLISNDGPRNLTAACPKSVSKLEDIIGSATRS